VRHVRRGISTSKDSSTFRSGEYPIDGDHRRRLSDQDADPTTRELDELDFPDGAPIVLDLDRSRRRATPVAGGRPRAAGGIERAPARLPRPVRPTRAEPPGAPASLVAFLVVAAIVVAAGSVLAIVVSN
jgi:hypothetical protein